MASEREYIVALVVGLVGIGSACSFLALAHIIATRPAARNVSNRVFRFHWVARGIIFTDDGSVKSLLTSGTVFTPKVSFAYEAAASAIDRMLADRGMRVKKPVEIEVLYDSY